MNQRIFKLGGGHYSLDVLAAMNSVAFGRLVEQARRSDDDLGNFLSALTEEELDVLLAAHRVTFQQLLEEFGQVRGSSEGGAEDLETLLAELDAMVGLSAVKEEVRGLINTQAVHEARKGFGLPEIDETHHLVFTGNPGTGKTAVARLLSRIYRSLGVVDSDRFVEVDRAGLVGQHVGETALKTEQRVAEAMDGVLFIDEAYSLAPPQGPQNDFGSEAITTLVKAMEDHRDRLVLVVAGYTDEMGAFIDSNPGLKSRFKHFIDFPDYEVGELQEIFLRMCSAAQIEVPNEMHGPLLNLIEELRAQELENGHFGNAREMRRLFEICFQRKSARINEDGVITEEELQSFALADLPDLETLIAQR